MIAGLKDDAWTVRNPPHPGQFIRSGCLDAADDYPGMTVSEAADKLGVSRAAFSRVVNGQRPVTLALAMKMEAVGWSTADIWLELQARYDIAQERKRLNRPLAAAPAVRDIERMKAEAEVETEVETAAAA